MKAALHTLPLAITLLAGCSTSDPSTDSVGETGARRIVVVAPAAVEILEELDALDRVVGVSDALAESARLSSSASVGSFRAPSVERILALEADLFLTSASRAAQPVHDRLVELGVPVLALDTSTFEGVFHAIDALGVALGHGDDARGLVAGIRSELATIEQRGAALPRRSVLFVVGREPLFVAGPGSHIDEMIRLVGGTNVAGDLDAPYGQVSLESMLKRRPDVIVDTSGVELRGRTPGPWGAWEFLPAVRSNDVYFVDPEELVIPGVRLPEMTRYLGSLVHPGEFGAPSVRNDVDPGDLLLVANEDASVGE